jgi:ribosome-associated translation inhibitor RaiA
MEVAVRARDIVWNEDLHERVQRSIEFAVDCHSSRIDRISVYLADLNGPRGGVDKLCQITAEIRGAKPVRILEKGDDLVTAVNRAARRLGYRIGRRVHRRRIAGAPEHRGTIRVT